MSKRRVTALVAVLFCSLLLVSSVGRAQSSGPPGYVVEQGTASGGGYHLTSTTWQARGIASGGGYRLAVPASPAGTGTPCCCTYLPCVLRNH
jgi:hypothetical protein